MTPIWMYTPQAFLAPTSRQKTGPVRHSPGRRQTGLEARTVRTRAHRSLAHHGCDVLQCGERIAALDGAGDGTGEIVLSHPKKSLQFVVAAGLQRCDC